MIKSIEKYYSPDSNETTFAISISADEYIRRRLFDDFVREITRLLAEKYLEQHSDEILKRIHEQITDQKVIKKVVENLRKKLKGEKE